MPASFAEKLGLNVREGKSYEFGGPGSIKQPAWFFEVTLTIGGFSPFSAPVGFTPALERNAIGILGQSGFFDRFIIAFDLRNGLFHIDD